MRHKQVFDYDGLQEAAASAVKQAGLKQLEIAEALGVQKGSISRALKYSGAKYSNLQGRILEYLNPNSRIEQSTVFQAVRRDRI